tara:strand:- start:451 stop:768 length:318 start_codon:yes stop_codon:yes gene_type:complete
VFKKLENKIKELALKIHNSKSNDFKSIYEDSKKLYELTVIHKYLTNYEKGGDWILHEEKLKETLKSLNLETNKITIIPNNASEITPLIDSIKDLVTEIPESDDDK